MSHEVDLSFLDRPEILGMVFHPRRDFDIARLGDTHFLEVEPGVNIGCRYYRKEKDRPTILYFHGNGETVGDYDFVAPMFLESGLNLFVADYRGYGLSDGVPTISNLLADCHPVFEGFQRIVEEGGYRKDLFLMGRSLGSIPAIELASHYQDRVRGLIVESGGAGTVLRLLSLFGISLNDEVREILESASNRAKIQKVVIPTYIIHAERDDILPLEEGKALFENSGAEDKEMYVVPRAGHNDLWHVAGDEYMKRVRGFVEKNLSL